MTPADSPSTGTVTSRQALDARWWDAAAVLGVLASMLLPAVHLRPIAASVGVYLWSGIWLDVSTVSWIRAAAWIAVTLLVLLGYRGAMWAAWSAALMEAAALMANRADGVSALTALRPLILAVAVAALLSVPGSPRRGVSALGTGRLVLFGGAALLCALGPMVVWLRSSVGPWRKGWGDGFGIIAVEVRWVAAVTATAAVIVAIGLVAVLVSLDSATRRPALVILAPLAVAVTIVQFSTDRAFAIPTLERPLLAGALPWLLLATLPALAFAAALASVSARDRRSGSA